MPQSQNRSFPRILEVGMQRGLYAVFLFLAMTMLGNIGCQAAPRNRVAPAAATGGEAVVHLSTTGRVPTGEKADRRIAREDVKIVFQLDIYQVTVPFGAVSRNDRFWHHVDEDHVDLFAHDLLLKNGLRIGIGPNNEWDYFKNLIDQYGATAQKGSVAPVKKGSLELPMRTGVDFQDIFYLSAKGTLYGRSYEKCDNLLSLTFEATPRRLGSARIEACAVVRGIRKQYEVTILNDSREIELRHPEYLYDLRLSQDVPLDHFLVMAPSPVAAFPDSLGHTFFVKPAGPTPTETVLLLVPRPYRITGEVPNPRLNRSGT